MTRQLLCSLCFLLVAVQAAFGQQKMTATAWWSDVAERTLTAPSGAERLIVPQKSRAVALDVAALEAALPTGSTPVELVLPTPTGEGARFRVWANEVMAPALRAKYPQIKTFSAVGLDDPTATAKLDLSPWGFHAMIRSANTGTSFIDPYFFNDASKAVVYFKKDYRRRRDAAPFECLAADETALNDEELTLGPGAETATPDAGDCQLRQYRLALSCTGEYAAFHGGNVPQVLAAMVTSVNRVNEVYEQDLAVTMQLIANNDTLIFLNSSTDPFSNGNGGTMLGQNQTTVTQRIGSANYDIGHVFSTGGGGVAGLGVVCSNGSKARGVTGSGAPIGDAFDIDYVAHEMGHQFGGNHCFNNSCGGNINQSTAMEPGSGSTIMAYAGICSPDVQSNSDDYFHAISIQEIAAFITTGTGNNCPVKTVTGNNAPTVNNVANFTIPKSTPFALTAVGNDADGDPLTYCWEQMDPQSATMPPVSTNTVGPLFRSFDPTPSPTRYFPRLSDLVTNTNFQWEELPGVARTMKFRVTVRDNFPTASCTAEDDVTVTVSGASGPFAVTVPNTAVIWNVGENQTVTWNVAGSDLAPVSCANVRILLSTDGGFNYPVVLADNVPNNGSAVVSVPNNVSTTCRVKVESIGNIFFDISNVNFRIQLPPTPTFTLGLSASSASVCAGESTEVTLTATSLVGFNLPVDVSVAGAPVGADVQFSANPLTPTGTTTLTISGLTPAMAGTYPIVLTAVGGTITQTATFNLSVLPGAPATVAAGISPADGSSGVGGSLVGLLWSSVEFASGYTIEVSTNPDFAPGNVVATLTDSDTTVKVSDLSLGTPYYWRVQANNTCGAGPWSGASVFQTSSVASCDQTFNSTNVPVAIDVNGAVNVLSTLEVPSTLTVTDVNVTLNIAHTWVGDIDALLVNPSGDTVVLFNRPGEPASQFGCGNDDLFVTLDDEATQTATNLEDACNGTSPAISGTYQPAAALSAFDNKGALGTWQLLVNDYYPGEDEGSINGWSLNFCLLAGSEALTLASNSPLTLNAGTAKAVANTNLAANALGAATQVRFTLTSLPAHGTLSLNGTPLTLGGTFSQDDINTGKIVYTHGGNAATSDACTFDILDQSDNAWLHNATLSIVIVQNTLVTAATLTQGVTCYNAATGEITVTANGGTAPLTYSLNGGTAQSSAVFSGLVPGTYTPTVTDANGFTSTVASITIANPTAISANTSVTDDDLTVTATGGTGPLTYSVNGVDFQPIGVFENLADNIYTVTVRDSVGCVATLEVLVSVGTLLSNTVVVSTPACFGDATGSFTVNVAGGVAPYQYSIVADSTQASNTFTGLAAGSYVVTVTDESGNTTVTNATVISQPNALGATATAALNVVTVAATGGTTPYQYSLDGGAPQSSPTFTVADGDYTVVVTDANGCQTSTTVSVSIPPLAITGFASTIPADCDGVLGNLFVEATGGVPPYEYRLDGGDWQSSNVFFNIAPGAHEFEVRDAAGTVSAGFPLTIVAPVPLLAQATVVGNDVSISVTGGELPYFYTLPNNGQNLANGNYNVTVTDARGCTTTATFTVSYQAPSLTTTSTNVSCFGGSDGSVTVTLVGGIQPFTYEYSPAQPWTNVPAGTYSLTVTDGAGTTASITATVTQPQLLTANALFSSTNIDDIVVSVAGGTGPFTYSLDGGVTTQTSNTLVNNPAGDYVVTVQDANGCTTTTNSVSLLVGTVNPTQAWGVQVAPNPSRGLFTITLNAAPTGDLLLETLDATGRLLQHEVFELSGNQWQTSLDLSQLPAGVYVLRFTTGSRTGALRLNVVR